MRFRSPEPKPPAEGARATGLRRVSLVESVAIQLMSEPINTDGLRKVQAAGDRPALGRARPRARAPRIEEIPSDCAADALERARRRGSKR